MTRNRGKGADPPQPSPAAAPQPPVASQSRTAQAPAAPQSPAASQPPGGSQPVAAAKAGSAPQSRVARRRPGRSKPASGPKADGPAEPASRSEPGGRSKRANQVEPPDRSEPGGRSKRANQVEPAGRSEPAGPATASPTTPAPDSAPSRLADLALRIVGLLVGMAGGLVTAVIEAFLTPLRIGSTRAPFSILLAVAGNVLLVWFTYRATSHRGAAVLPGLVWFAVMIIAAGRTSEGDLLMTGNNWVGVATIFAGTIGFAGALYRLILPRRPTP